MKWQQCEHNSILWPQRREIMTDQFLRKPHSKSIVQFWGSFCGFWQGILKKQDFRQNISNPARCSAFFMYTLFLLKNKSSWRNLGFTVENVVENMVIQVLCVWIERFPLIHLTFSTVFSTVNRIFLLEDLLLGKKSVYMKNAEERAGFKIFWRKSWKLTSSLSKSTKTTGKLCNVFTVWFPK